MTFDSQACINETKERMAQSLDVLRSELSKFRTGRAHTGLLEHLTVQVYGSSMPLSQVANITAESQSLVVTPWDRSQVSAIEKAIRESELGLNPATVGDKIRVVLPPLTQERRQSLLKLVGQEAEKAKVAIRNIRRDVLQDLKSAVKDKILTEDDEYALQAQVQKVTDDTIKFSDQIRQDKEKELQHI
jgi:ribosome recycling factor